MRILNVAATGMMAQQLSVEVISNNIANMQTTGYKRRRAEFQDLLYQSYKQVGTQASGDGGVVPSGIQLGAGVKPGTVYRVHQQGDLVGTDNPLDLAIQGKGMLVVELPNGDFAYTRSGQLQVNNEGTLVTADGYPIDPQIQIPEDAISVTISPEGIVEIRLQGEIDPQQVGQIELASFINPAGLDALGKNLLAETAASGEAIINEPGTEDMGTLLQGFLESANVDAVSEMTALITAQRAYDLNSKVISAGDEMMAAVTNLR